MIKGLSRAKAISLDVTHEKSLDQVVSEHDLVISLIPYTQHALVIASAIKNKKHFVSTSYVSPTMAAFDQA
jgi:saccharopine dehydrogenase-like NADP-dependent oxidoreductase